MKKVISMILVLTMVFTLVVGFGTLSFAATQVAKVTSNTASGKYTTNLSVKLTAEAGATIYYTLDGKTPTTSSTKYTAAVNVTKTSILKAIAVKTGSTNSAVAVFAYTIAKPAATNLTGKITMSGASALFPLAKYIGDLFKAQNPKVSLNITAGGSGAGLNNVIQGVVDIGNSDVYVWEKNPGDTSKLEDHKICVVGIAMVAHPDTGVTNLTKQQVKDIYAGTVTNWKQVGGNDVPIIVVHRTSGSGTRTLFLTFALDKQKELSGSTAITVEDSNTLLKTVSQTKGAIGYLAMSYTGNTGNKVTLLNLDGVTPTYQNIYDGKWPVWGYEHMYTKGAAAGVVKAFIDFASDPSLVSHYEKLGYGAISKLSKATVDAREKFDADAKSKITNIK